MPISDETVFVDHFEPAAPEDGSDPSGDASEARAFPDAVRARARSSRTRAAPLNAASQVEVRKAMEGSRAALESSRLARRGTRQGGSAFDAAGDGGGTRGTAGNRGDAMSRPKRKRRIGIIRLGMIVAVCAVGGTYAGLYLQQLFNDALPKSSVYEQAGKTAPPPSSGYTF